MFSDPVARRFSPMMDEAAARLRWISWSMENYESWGFGLWVIEHRDSGEFLGDCGLTYQPVEEDRLLEVGYHLVAGYRGNGYATEAGRACIEHAFANLQAPLVCSIVDPENTGSIHVASRLHDSSRRFENESGRDRLLFWSVSAEPAG
jgi:RimJ/RimL family protein N-acetyltransferase